VAGWGTDGRATAVAARDPCAEAQEAEVKTRRVANKQNPKTVTEPKIFLAQAVTPNQVISVRCIIPPDIGLAD
jgi:hypothetical protein